MSGSTKGRRLGWTWLPASPTGGAGGAAYSKLFRNDTLPIPDLLVREVLQNSWDAAQAHQDRDAPPFRFVFRFRSLSASDKAALVKHLDIGTLVERRRILGMSRDLPASDEVERLVSPDEPLRVLYLEDYGTHGMYGDPSDPINSHLYRALYILGSTGKDTAGTAQGGSFGFGKSAFIRSSATRMAIAHTRFAPRPDDHTTQRLVGFTWWGEHATGEGAFEGRAMFGTRARMGDRATPLEGEDAARVASLLGMCERDGDLATLGSTVMVVEPTAQPEEVRSAIETYWWPAIEDNLMDVTVVTDTEDLLIPRPRNRREILPFVTAYGIANGLKEPSPGSNEKLASEKWRARHGFKVGNLALVVDSDAAEGSGDQASQLGDLSGPLVALVRSPRMVIEYKQYNSRMPIRGVFVASPEADTRLRDVEPPLHNSWSSSSGNEVDEESRTVAAQVLRSIDREVRAFALELSPPPAFLSADLPLFGEVLARFLSGKAPGPAHPPTGPGPIGGSSLEILPAGGDRRERVGPGRIRLTRDFELRVPQGLKWEGSTLSLTCVAHFAEDLSGRRSEPLDVEISVPPELTKDVDGRTYTGVVAAGSRVPFSVTTEAYDDGLSVILSPNGELRAAEVTGVGR